MLRPVRHSLQKHSETNSPKKNHAKIFVNTIPKSGSVFILTALQELAGCEHLVLGTGYVPNDSLLLDQARKFSQGGFAAQQHADCRPNNLAILEKFVPKWVVHLRDPRSVTLSWTHHLDKFVALNQRGMLDYVAPIPGEDYLALDFSGRLDWQITHFLPHIVHWTASWLEYADRNADRVLVSTYEQMIDDQAAFFRRLLNFFDISNPELGDLSRFRSEAHHFRKGEVAEWRSVFTEEQKARSLAAIPETLRTRMAWPVD
ncbi:sulfotransferase domain-containing protein [Bradyrhizobium sp. STM 3562]|uniref:sulfotransferase domain-containing protein n=1 Tax=Bradyrhizobium sp. STM 3562 TaxID=578924 RepID=UPI00388DBC93